MTHYTRNGEKWVFTNGLGNDGRFSLAGILASRDPVPYSPANPTTKVYRAAQIPEINVTALTYFAASMFWRASVYPWKRDGTCPVPLGPHQEPLRRFLMGGTGFPQDVALIVVVREPSVISHLALQPLGEWRGDHLVCKFPMPGLVFFLAAGKALPAAMYNTCFVRGAGNPIVLSAVLEQLIFDECVTTINRRHRNMPSLLSLILRTKNRQRTHRVPIGNGKPALQLDSAPAHE